MDKKIVLVISLLMALMLICSVSAISAKIGNGIMVLRANTGESLEKSILVMNDNSVSLNVALSASGDLADNIQIKDSNFSLSPGEEKKAYFTIKANEAGTTESKINVMFTPAGEKNGAVLSSKITFIAKGETIEEDEKTETNTPVSASNSISGKIIAGGLEKKYIIALAATGITSIIFIVLLIIYFKTKNTAKKSEIKILKTKLKKSVKKSA